MPWNILTAYLYSEGVEPMCRAHQTACHNIYTEMASLRCGFWCV